MLLDYMRLFRIKTSKHSLKTLAFVSSPKPAPAQHHLFSTCSSQSALKVQLLFGASSLAWLNPFYWLVLLWNCHTCVSRWWLPRNACPVFQTFLRCAPSNLKFSSFCSRQPAESFEYRYWPFQQSKQNFNWVFLIESSHTTEKSVLAAQFSPYIDLECV